MKNIIDFSEISQQVRSSGSRKKNRKILSIDIFEHTNDEDFHYTMRRYGNTRYTDQFMGYCITRVLRDIVEYCGDPADINEVIEEIEARLGFSENINGDDNFEDD